MKNEITFLLPSEKRLADKIKLYYFHIAPENNYQNEITYYPNYTSTLNVYQNSAVSWNEYERTHRYQAATEPLKLLVGKFNKSRKINIVGPLHKITIVFHPLGLNHFVSVPLATLIAEHFSFFNYFGDAFNQTIAKVFQTKKLEEKRNLLDTFFTNQLHPFTETRLTQAVQYILNTNETIKINDLSKQLNIHRRTLLRLFQKHLGYSVEEYISVVKFRKAILNYQQYNYSLTRVAQEANYYDQADFIKNCNFKCGQSPKQLFAELKVLEKDLFWKFK